MIICELVALPEVFVVRKSPFMLPEAIYMVPDMLDEVEVAGIENVHVCVAPEAMRSCMLCLTLPATVAFAWSSDGA